MDFIVPMTISYEHLLSTLFFKVLHLHLWLSCEIAKFQMCLLTNISLEKSHPFVRNYIFNISLNSRVVNFKSGL